MGRDFSHMDRKGVTKNLIKKIIPSLKLHHYIQNDIEPLLDLGVILEKLFGFSRSRLKFWNRSYEVSVFVCSYEYLIFFKLSLFMNFWKYHTSITHIDTYEHTNTETS